MKASNFFSAIAGAIIAGVAVHFYEKKRADIRVEEVKKEATKFYLDKLQEEKPVEEEQTAELPEEEQTDNPVWREEYTSMVDDLYSAPQTEELKNKTISYISNSDAGTDGYGLTMLTYYADNVLVDENYKIIPEDDIIEFVGGRAFAKHFGDFGDPGVITVRNETLEMDFEIDQDPRNWRDFKKTIPSFPSGRGPFDDED